MEAAPKLQMMSFDFIVPPDKEKRYPDIAGTVERFILARHQDDPGTYTDELRQLRDLQRQAYQVPRSAQGLETLKRYLGQLEMLQARFPLGSSSTDAACADLQFTWYDAFSGEKILATDVRLEEACIMHNIAALHSYLGADSARATAEQMKQSCTHFQFAAWAFEQVKSMYSPIESPDAPSIPSLSKGYLNYARLLMLAQAQECILEKSLLDSRKPMTIAKVAAQAVQYYREAEQISAEQCGALRASPAAAALFADLVSLVDCIPTKYLQFKQHYYNVVMYYACGCHADDAQKMGERVAYFAEAQQQLETATKTLHKTDEASRCAEALQFVGDVVGTKLQAAKKDNDFIYHEKVPKVATLPPVACANLVKPVAFDITSPDVADIFHALVPMSVYEQLSIYSEKKAEKLRGVLAQVEFKNDSLAEFMSSVDVDTLKTYRRKSVDETARQQQNLPQELLDACADVGGAPKSTEQMQSKLAELNQLSMQLGEQLATLRKTIVERGLRAEHELAGMQPGGIKRPMLKFNELLQNLEQYERAHAQAKLSNTETEKLLSDQQNLTDWKLLRGHVDDVARSVPRFSLMDAPNVEEQLTQLDVLIDKVHEMKRQRDEFVEQLRKAMDNDDIRQAIMLAMSPSNDSATKTSQSPNFDAVFERELKKFQPTIDLLEQNMRAQEKIVDAIVDANAKCAELRQYVVGTIGARDKRVRKLLDAAVVFDEVSRKVDAGSKFYDDFKKHIEKLDEQVRERLQQFEAFKSAQQQQQQAAAAAAEQIRNRPPPTNVVGGGTNLPLTPMPNSTNAATQPPVSNGYTSSSGTGGGLTLGDYMRQMKLSANAGGVGNPKFNGPPQKLNDNIPNNFRYNQAQEDDNAALRAAQEALRSLPSPALRSGAQQQQQRPVFDNAYHQQMQRPPLPNNMPNMPQPQQQQLRPLPPSHSSSNFTTPLPAQPLMHPFMQSNAEVSQPSTLQPQSRMPTISAPPHITSSSGYFTQHSNSGGGGGFAASSQHHPSLSNNTQAGVNYGNVQYYSSVPPPPSLATAHARPQPSVASAYQPSSPVIRAPAQQPYMNNNNSSTTVYSGTNSGGSFHVPQQPSAAVSISGGNFLPATNNSSAGFAWQPSNNPPQMPSLLMPTAHAAPPPMHSPAVTAGQNSGGMLFGTVPSTAAISSRYSAMLPADSGVNSVNKSNVITPPVLMSVASMPAAPPSALPPQSTLSGGDQQQRMSAYSSLLDNNSNARFQQLQHSVSAQPTSASAGSLVSSYAQLLSGAGKTVPTQPDQRFTNAAANGQYTYQTPAGYAATTNGASVPQQYVTGQYAAATAQSYANGHSSMYQSQQPLHPSLNGVDAAPPAPFTSAGDQKSTVVKKDKSFSSDLDELMGWSAAPNGVVSSPSDGGVKPSSTLLVDSLAMPHAAPDPNSLI